MQKADAERHVASVTLINSPRRGTDPAVDELARRKGAKDFSPLMPGTPVAEAIPRTELKSSFAGANFTFQLLAPPQLDRKLVAQLAANQVQALFAMITTEDWRDPTKMRLLPGSHIYLLGDFHRADWGNPLLLAVEARARAWKQHAILVTAKDHFKAVLRRGADHEGWFWALEWNHYIRVAGAIFHPDSQPPLLAGLQDPGWTILPDGRSRMRLDTPLDDTQDRLFDFDADDNTSSGAT